MKLRSFLTRCIQILSALTVGGIFILNLLYNATVSSDAAEVVTIQWHTLQSLLFLLIAAALLFALSFLKKLLETVKTPHLFLVCAAIYVAMGIYLIANVDHTLRADAHIVSQAAKDLLAGSFSAMQKGGYMYQYPHQIGLMLYDALLYLIYKGTSINFVANLSFAIGINYLIYRTADLLFDDRLTSNLAVLMSFAFLPQFFFVLFAYGNIPGLFFMLFSFYYTLRFCKTHRTIDLICVAVGVGAAVLLRKNFLIGVIAIGICLCLDMLKRFSAKHLVALAAVAISLLLPLKILPAAFIGDTGGMPSVLWIAMGTDIDNDMRAPGWYDGSNNYIFHLSDYDSAIAQEKGVEKIQNNIRKITTDPRAAGGFFLRKTISQWCNPLYQSLWSGPLTDCGQQTHTPLLQSLYTGGSAEDILSNGMKIYVLAFFGLGLLFILRYHKQYDGWQVFFLTLIGGFLFHLIWEGKSQYVYPYFFSLMPFAALAMAKIITGIQTRVKKKAE